MIVLGDGDHNGLDLFRLIDQRYSGWICRHGHGWE